MLVIVKIVQIFTLVGRITLADVSQVSSDLERHGAVVMQEKTCRFAV